MHSRQGNNKRLPGKCKPSGANEKSSPAQELEARWVGAQPGLPPEAPEAVMAEATLTLPRIQPELGTVKSGSRGSKFGRAATCAEGMSARLNEQLKEQERIVDTADAPAASLQDSARPPGQLTSATSLEWIPVGRLPRSIKGVQTCWSPTLPLSAKTCSRACQPCRPEQPRPCQLLICSCLGCHLSPF